MSAIWLCVVSILVACMVVGCGLKPTRFDAASRDYSTLRDAPSDKPIAVLLEVTAGGDAERERVAEEVNGILAESGRSG